MKLDPRNSVKAYPHHTVSGAWCYDHYVSKLTLCDLGLYHMYTSICVLMYLYYIYLLISAMITLRWSPAHILRATTTPDFEQGWWSVCVGYGLLVVRLAQLWESCCVSLSFNIRTYLFTFSSVSKVGPKTWQKWGVFMYLQISAK